MITISELLGTNSIAGDRLTINANFLLLENEINDLETTFNINTVTGVMDISTATNGLLKAKSSFFNTLVMPSSGTPTVSIYGTGASAGNGSFAGILTAQTLSVAGTATTGALVNSGTASFVGASSFNGAVVSNNELCNGPTGINTDKNRMSIVGSTVTFPGIASTGAGGGIVGTYSNPYVITGQESTIYINAGNVSTLPDDSGNATGFYFSVSAGTGGTPATIGAGFKISLINTNPNVGLIGTGVTGPTLTQYYTGFNTGEGQYNTAGISVPSGSPYKSSVSLMWEPRINQSASSQKGSWVVIGSSLITAF